MSDNTYETENNGSGYADDFVPGKKNVYHPLNTINSEDVSNAFQEETDTDENGLGYGDDSTYDDVE